MIFVWVFIGWVIGMVLVMFWREWRWTHEQRFHDEIMRQLDETTARMFDELINKQTRSQKTERKGT